METQKHLDFHTHTRYSDGLQTPEELIKAARFNGIDYLAITDHDNVRAHRNSKELGNKWGVEIVGGVEISTDKYHMLGLGINPQAASLTDFLALSERAQRNVCQRRIEGLQLQGIPIGLEKVVRCCPESRLGKMNIWYTMVQDAECQEYFRNQGVPVLSYPAYSDYLANSSVQIYDKDTEIVPEEAIRQIHLAGGKAFIAHPFKDITDLKELDVLVEQGMDGLEIQPNFNGRNTETREYALRNNLLVTYGSDWHGGIFERAMLKWEGENVLTKRLADALGLEV
ncbi:MAG: PHP domain-containing protein [archaeon]